MKRCPQCNRVEADDTLAFCRADGTTLVRKSGAVGESAGTLKFGSTPVARETETRILPQAASASPTGDAHSRPTAPTTLLDPRRSSGGTQELIKAKSRWRFLIAAAAIIAVALATSAYFYLARGKSITAKNSIAVLPFQNASGDPNVEYLSDGISESLINSLSQLPDVRVMARTTMFSFKGKDADPRAIGKQLGMDAVLTGRVVQRGDSLTIQADLVNVSDGSQIWGERYSRKAADILAVQEDIAREIISKLRPKLSGEQQGRVNKRYTASAEAYKLYLQGRFHWNKRTDEGVRKSIDYFKQAIELDPSYALAFAGLADAYSVMPSYSDVSPDEYFPKAKVAAKRGLELDETLAEAHTALARVLFAYDWNFPESDREYQRAIELNPNYATAHHWYGNANLLRTGRFEEAIAEGKRARELDPLSLVINADLGEVYLLARRYDEAILQLRKTIELDERFDYAHWWLGAAYLMKGSLPEAIAEYTRARQLNENQRIVAHMGQAYGVSGNRDKALGFLAQLKEMSKKGYVRPYSFAIVYAGLGQKEQAFQWLDKAYQERNQELTRLKVDPFLEPLRSDPRFADLMRRVGLPQ